MELPIKENHKLILASGLDSDDPNHCRSLVRCLIHLIITHPKLCYTIHILSLFMQNPNATHRVLRYLKATLGCGVLLRSDSCLKGMLIVILTEVLAHLHDVLSWDIWLPLVDHQCHGRLRSRPLFPALQLS